MGSYCRHCGALISVGGSQKRYCSTVCKLKKWSKPDEQSGCWLWTGACYAPSGYGMINIGTTYFGAHRLSYEEFVGPIPPGQCVLHRCDVRKCINPEHLFLGTLKDNVVDMVKKSRQARGAQNGGAKITEEGVRAIRAEPCGGRALSLKYGLSPTQIKSIRSRKSWKHVE